MSPVEFAVAAAIVAVGACVQGSIGFGLNIIAAPVLIIIDPRLVPGPTLVTALVLTVLIARREWASIDLARLRWALVGRVPGSIAGAVAVTALSERGLGLTLASLVLVAVLISAAGWQVRPGPRTLLGAGAASGFMGTVTSIGGPPMALVYQGARGSELRGNLSGFFVVGVFLSLGLLTALGEFGIAELEASLALLPGLLVGFALSGPARRFLDRGHTRPAVLGLAAVSAVGALIRYL